MHPDIFNINFISKTLGSRTFIQRQKISGWYRKKIKPDLKYYNQNGEMAFKYLNQVGGDEISLQDNGKLYRLNVEILQAQPSDSKINPIDIESNAKSDKSGEILLDLSGSLIKQRLGPIDNLIYFFSINGDHNSSCSVVEIYSEHGTALISDINTLYNCFTPIDAKKRCRLITLATISYIKHHGVDLKIDRIILQDSSFYECDKSGFTLELTKTRQLCGDYPYYYKYGFYPIYESSNEKVRYNLAKLVGLKIMDKLYILEVGLNYFASELKGFRFVEISEFMKNNLHTFLTDFFRHLFINYCAEMSYLYDRWYGDLGLKLLHYNETYYELIF